MDFEIQKGIFAALNGVISCSIYDHVPQDAAFPYCVIGDDSLSEFDSKGYDGQVVDLTIHTFSKASGRKEAKELLKEVYDVLHNGSISVTGATVVYCRYVASDSFQQGEINDKYYHGIINFEMVVRHD